MGRCVPVAKGFEAETIAVNYHCRNMEQGELQIRHVNAFWVYIDGGHVEVLLIVDTGLPHFVCKRYDHGAAAGRGFLCRDKAAFRDPRFKITAICDGHLSHHPAKRIRREILSGPLVVEFQIVERATEDIADFLFKGHREIGEHFRKPGEFVRFVALHDLQVSLFSFLPAAPIDSIANRNRRHFDEVGENLPMPVAIAEPFDGLHEILLMIRRGAPAIFAVPDGRQC